MFPIWAAAATEPPPTLTTAAAVAAAEVPAVGDPPTVLVEAVVSYQDAARTTFLVDATGVTDFFGGVMPPSLAPGDRVRVEGVLQKGGFMGAIKARRIEMIGRGPPPVPIELVPADFAAGLHVFRRAALEGIVRTVESAGELTTRLRLWSGGDRATIMLEEGLEAARSLVGGRVRAIGIVAGDVNDRREVIDPWLRVRSLADVEVLEPGGDPFAAPRLAADDLPRARAEGRRVLVRGTVTAGPVGGGLFLRQGGRGLFVETSATEPRRGDIVEAAGFVELGVYSLFLADADCRIVGRETPPQPRRVSAATLQDTRAGCEADLVVIDAQVVQQLDLPEGKRLMLDVTGTPVTVHAGGAGIGLVPTGSEVRVTGPMRGTAVRRTGYRTAVAAADLWLTGPDALVVLRQPLWWTPRRITLAAVGAAAAAIGVGAIAAVWIWLLKQQVRRQLAVIAGGVRAEAVTDERRRIAGEFHDSLEQGLAAMSLRLGMTAARLPSGDARGVLEHQRQLLAWLQTETREFLWDLRDPVPADQNLAETLAIHLESLRDLTAVPLTITLPAAVPSFAPAAQHQVSRIVREAVHNAICHAQAKTIDVSLTVSDAGPLVVEVADDGHGCDVVAATGARGHYGLRGMEERATRIGGTLTIRSGPGEGTVVRLEVPVPDVVGREGDGESGLVCYRSPVRSPP